MSERPERDKDGQEYEKGVNNIFSHQSGSWTSCEETLMFMRAELLAEPIGIAQIIIVFL